MTTPLNNLKHAAEHIRLSVHEKDLMRAQIMERIGASKRAQAAQRRPVYTSYFFFAHRFAVSLAIILIVALGSGTAYAAQGALPGTALYPVKIYVNENVQGAFAFSDDAKLAYHTSLAQTRLEEAETLASEGKLDASNTAEIESNLSAHVAAADAITQKIEANDPADAEGGAVVLDSSLAAHTAILNRIGSGSTDGSTKENAHALATAVRVRGDQSVAAADLTAQDNTGEASGTVVAVAAPAVHPMAMALSVSVSASTSDESSSTPAPVIIPVSAKAKVSVTATITAAPQATTTQRKIAAQLQKKAASELSDTQDTYNDLADAISATTSVDIKVHLADLNARMNTGNQAFAAGDYDSARTIFTGVLQDSVELTTYIEASKTFKHNFVTSWGTSDDDN